MSGWIAIGMVLMLAATPVVGGTVEVGRVDGAPLSGELVELSPERVVVRKGQQETSVEFANLLGLTFAEKGAAAAKAPPFWIMLIDGSRLPAERLTVQNRMAQASFGNDTLKIPTRDVAAVRLGEESAALAKRWETIAAARAGGDRLVMRKGNDALDVLEGTIRDVTAETVEFELDGETLKVKRPRVYGLLYYQSSARAAKGPAGFAIGRDGSRLAIGRVAVSGDELRITTLTGLDLIRPVASIARLDFSAGKLSFLSDLEPESQEVTPLAGTPRDLPELTKLDEPRRDRTLLGGGPLTLARRDEDGRRNREKYDKGLSLRSRTKLVYRLPAEFRSFTAWAGIDSHVRDGGRVQFTILGDDKPLLSTAVSLDDDPRRVQLDLRGVRRLTVLVDFGDDLDVGDFLNLCDARLMK